MSEAVHQSAEVAAALGESRPVVALESTIFSNLGLPSPANLEALERSTAAIEAVGAVPAVTAVLDGVPRLGLERSEWERILGPATKVAERDLGIAVARRERVGATTVSASVTIAAACGVGVFATGGIGGVHRGVETTGDISADLGALARHSVITVCAGAKVFLDLAKTLEYLDTVSVPVFGWRTDFFPAFYALSSGLAVPHRVERGADVAAAFQAQRALGLPGGVLIGVPIPDEYAIATDVLDAAIDRALASADERGITGAGVTPEVLAGIAEATAGMSITANLALSENNAKVAAEIAVAVASA